MICTSVIIVGKMTVQSWKKFKILYFFWPSTKELTISQPLKMESWNFHRLCRLGTCFYNLYFPNHSWKNDCAELEKVWHFALFLTFHKWLHHFLTVKDGKLKFSQNMQIKSNLMICTLVNIVGKITMHCWKTQLTYL